VIMMESTGPCLLTTAIDASTNHYQQDELPEPERRASA